MTPAKSNKGGAGKRKTVWIIMMTCVVALFVAVVWVVSAILKQDGKGWWDADVPEFTEKAINLEEYIPVSSIACAVIDDFHGFFGECFRTPLGKALTCREMKAFFGRFFAKGEKNEIDVLSSFLRSIRSVAFAVTDNDYILFAELNRNGEDAFRNLLSYVCVRSGQGHIPTLVVEEKEGRERLCCITGSGESKPAFEFDIRRNLLVISLGGGGTGMIPASPMENHFEIPRVKNGENAKAQIRGAYFEEESGEMRKYHCGVDRRGFHWSVETPKSLLGEITGPPLDGLIPGIDSPWLVVVLNADICVKLMKKLGYSAEGGENIYGNEIPEDFLTFWTGIEENISSGSMMLVIPKNIMGGLVLTVPVSDSGAAIDGINESVRARDMKLCVGKGEPPIYYLKNGESLSAKLCFWTRRDGKIHLSTSQFALSETLRSKTRYVERLNTAYGYLQFNSRNLIDTLAPIVSMGTSMLGVVPPNLKAVEKYFEKEELTLEMQEGNYVIKGDTSMPVGLALLGFFSRIAH